MEQQVYKSVPKHFKKESKNIKIGKVVVREIKILDQYSSYFENSVEKFKTPVSICGYVVSAVAPYLASEGAFLTDFKAVNVLTTNLNDPSFIVPRVNNVMEIIQAQRTQYINDFGNEFKNIKEKNSYMKDWVAVYEISDYIKIMESHHENLYFERINTFQFPELMKDLKHEELRRIKEEEPFKDEVLIMERFYLENKLMTTSTWSSENHMENASLADKPVVIIGDLKGHYVTFMACKVVKEDGDIEPNVLLFNSVDLHYLHCEAVLEGLANMLFPEESKS